MSYTIKKFRKPEKWLEARRKYITATDAAIIAGASSFGSPYSLWVDKIKGREYKDPNELMVLGQNLEDGLAKTFTHLTGISTKDLGRHTLCISNENPWAAATLDRLVQEGPAGGYTGVLEIKVRNQFTKEDWTEDKVPSPVWVQIQHQLMVTGYSYGYAFGLVGGFPKWSKVERDCQFISNLIIIEQKFISRVKLCEPPEVDASEHTREAINRLHPEDNGNQVSLDCLEEWQEIQDLNRQKKELDEAIALRKNKIISAIGDNTYGLLRDGTRLSYKTVIKKEHIVKESKYRQLTGTKKES